MVGPSLLTDKLIFEDRDNLFWGFRIGDPSVQSLVIEDILNSREEAQKFSYNLPPPRGVGI